MPLHLKEVSLNQVIVKRKRGNASLFERKQPYIKFLKKRKKKMPLQVNKASIHQVVGGKEEMPWWWKENNLFLLITKKTFLHGDTNPPCLPASLPPRCILWRPVIRFILLYLICINFCQIFIEIKCYFYCLFITMDFICRFY